MRQIESVEVADRPAARTGRRSLYFLVPVVGVNLMALSGQSLWFFGQMDSAEILVRTVLNLAILATASLLCGLILESIGVYLMMMAHEAALEGYSSGSLRLAAYVVAAIMATLNYSHLSHWSREMGIVFALVSFLSPFMWSIRIKAAARRALAARGQTDPAGVKLSTSRKLWHPIRSLSVQRAASWSGETDPARAVSAWEAARSGQSETAPPLRGEIEVETKRPEIETERAESETVTETETVTRTVERKRSVSSETRMRERLEILRERYPDWETENVTYEQIKEVLSLSGSQTVKGIRDALYGLTPQRDRVING